VVLAICQSSQFSFYPRKEIPLFPFPWPLLIVQSGSNTFNVNTMVYGTKVYAARQDYHSKPIFLLSADQPIRKAWFCSSCSDYLVLTYNVTGKNDPFHSTRTSQVSPPLLDGLTRSSEGAPEISRNGESVPVLHKYLSFIEPPPR